ARGPLVDLGQLRRENGVTPTREFDVGGEVARARLGATLPSADVELDRAGLVVDLTARRGRRPDAILSRSSACRARRSERSDPEPCPRRARHRELLPSVAFSHPATQATRQSERPHRDGAAPERESRRRAADARRRQSLSIDPTRASTY